VFVLFFAWRTNQAPAGDRSAGIGWDLRIRAANHAKCMILVFQSDRIPIFSIFRSGSFLLFPISAKLVGGYMGKAEQTGLQTKKNQTKKENESIDRLLRQTRLNPIKGNHARETNHAKMKTLLEKHGLKPLTIPMSAYDLRKSDPALAARFARFIEAEKPALVAMLSGKLLKR
jgi:hypothetical protein